MPSAMETLLAMNAGPDIRTAAFQGPERPVDSIRFGVGGNDQGFIGEGWGGDEPHVRWAVGTHSSLRIPPVSSRENLLLTASLFPIELRDKPSQQMIVAVNDRLIGELTLHPGNGEYAVVVPADILLPDRHNLVGFIYRHCASPHECDPRDARRLAVAFRRLDLSPTDFEFHRTPRLLRPEQIDTDRTLRAKQVVERFQSLGQNCEFGLVQRQCGAEPLGLLRFSSIRLERLLHGIRTRFQGIGDLEDIHVQCEGPGKEYAGHQQRYEIDYHTFRNEGRIDLDDFRRREAQRLRYLADSLMMEIDNADKVFVVQRSEFPLPPSEVLPLFAALLALNKSNALLYVTECGTEFGHLRNRVDEVAPGLYRARISKLAPGDDARLFDYPAWLKICSTVLSDMRENS